MDYIKSKYMCEKCQELYLADEATLETKCRECGGKLLDLDNQTVESEAEKKAKKDKTIADSVKKMLREQNGLE